MHRLIVILGPTASGKTALGVKLAKRFKGVILSADSRQVYHGLDAGTAKVTSTEMRGAPHFLLDIASPKRVFTVAQFQRAAQRVLKKIPVTTPVFIVGGSPFYIEAITNPTQFPNVAPNPTLRRRLERRTAAQLFSELRRRDPRRAASIDRDNKVRLIRALEIVAALGRVPNYAAIAAPNVLKLGLNPPRDVLYRNIDRRVDARIPAIIREIKKLRATGLSWKRLDQLGLEYRWIGRYVRGALNKTIAIERLKGDIHAFARRQLTWWRKDATIKWNINPARRNRLVTDFLSHRS